MVSKSTFIIGKYKLRSILQIIGSIIGLILIISQINNGISEFNGNLIEFINVRFLLSSLLFATIALFFQILGWNKLNSILGNNLSLRHVLFGYTFTFLPRYIPGTIWGYLTRSEWLLKVYNIPYKNSVFISMLEMILIFITNLTLGSLIIFFTTKNILLLIILIILPLITIIMINYFRKLSFGKKFIINDYLGKMSFSSWIIILIIFGISWILYGFSLICSISSFTKVVEFDINYVILITSINSLSWLIGFVVFFFPAGIGIRETMLNYFLIYFLFLPLNLSSSIAITNRIITLFAELILLICGYFLKYFISKQNNLLKKYN